MKSAHSVNIPDTINRGINGLAGADGRVKATYIAQPVDPSENGLSTGMQAKQNTAVRAVVVRQTGYKNLKTGEDFRCPSKDSAEQSLKEISSDPGPRAPHN
jgi:hypothetical protein